MIVEGVIHLLNQHLLDACYVPALPKAQAR